MHKHSWLTIYTAIATLPSAIDLYLSRSEFSSFLKTYFLTVTFQKIAPTSPTI
ncbi:hypothetical protein [Halotia branconii]|uniref:Uncharacterized protein n=1 Tax=Halotia branconii CENA392 TaxID=1539056 RepID=A0AAJ6NWQ9_9CYAN|nr:hypothetical protein [Halotia branconii]WGV27894.1 hypothetical protein QI031_10600 [Halotia branconii CENA392]